jgi:hypothetical protein
MRGRVVRTFDVAVGPAFATAGRINRLAACIEKAEQIAEFDETEANRVRLFQRETGAIITDSSHTYTLRCCGVSTSSTSGQLRLSAWLAKARAEMKRIAP